jgi:hypothetical protein
MKQEVSLVSAQPSASVLNSNDDIHRFSCSPILAICTVLDAVACISSLEVCNLMRSLRGLSIRSIDTNDDFPLLLEPSEFYRVRD